MTSILMGLQLLQRHLTRLQPSLAGDAALQTETLQALAKTVLQQGGRLNRLVNDLLDLSRIRAGRLDQHPEQADLTEVVRTAVEEQRQAAPERTILLSTPVGEVIPVYADVERIGQVVTNYLTNALRYSAERQLVDVGVRVEEQQGRVWVRDQGPGIPPSEQEHLWEPFHHVPGIAIQSGSGVGLGIGLYLCKMIIEQHGGQLGVESWPGEGSTFWFTLPLAVRGPGHASQGEGAPKAPTPSPWTEPGP